MSSILKRSLVVAAVVGVGVLPSYAMAAHNVSPGQTCKEQNAAGDFVNRLAGENQGDCASRVAKDNGHGG